MASVTGAVACAKIAGASGRRPVSASADDAAAAGGVQGRASRRLLTLARAGAVSGTAGIGVAGASGRDFVSVGIAARGGGVHARKAKLRFTGSRFNMGAAGASVISCAVLDTVACDGGVHGFAGARPTAGAGIVAGGGVSRVVCVISRSRTGGGVNGRTGFGGGATARTFGSGNGFGDGAAASGIQINCGGRRVGSSRWPATTVCSNFRRALGGAVRSASAGETSGSRSRRLYHTICFSCGWISCSYMETRGGFAAGAGPSMIHVSSDP